MASGLNRHTFRIARLDYMGRIIHTHIALYTPHPRRGMPIHVRSHAQSRHRPAIYTPILNHMHIIGHILSLTSDAEVAKFKVKWLFLLLRCCFCSSLF